MPVELRLAAAAVLAALVTLAATPVAIRVARRTGFYDVPERYKAHAAATPYLGGGAVLAGFVVAALAFGGGLGRLAPVVVGAVVLWVLGTVDDRRFVHPGWRILAEAGAAGGLWALDLGWSVSSVGAVDLLLTVLWVLLLVNSINLFDNLDGAAAGVAAAVAAGATGLALLEGGAVAAGMAVALAASCLAFLPYNLASPPRIFLGDGGSMPVGFVAAAVIMVASGGGSGEGWPALLVAALLAAVPLLDTLLVIVSRRRRGVSIMTGGRDHLTHRLHRRLRSVRLVTFAVVAAQCLVSAAALVAHEQGTEGVVGVAAGCALLGVVAVIVLETQNWAPQRHRSTA